MTKKLWENIYTSLLWHTIFLLKSVAVIICQTIVWANSLFQKIYLLIIPAYSWWRLKIHFNIFFISLSTRTFMLAAWRRSSFHTLDQLSIIIQLSFSIIYCILFPSDTSHQTYAFLFIYFSEQFLSQHWGKLSYTCHGMPNTWLWFDLFDFPALTCYCLIGLNVSPLHVTWMFCSLIKTLSIWFCYISGCVID